MTTKELKLSPQQEVIVKWVESGSGSAFVEAVAGAGKTTTLIEATKRMAGDVALCAFNKKIAEEISARLEPLQQFRSPATTNLRRVKAGTFHSFGFAAWRNVAPRMRVDERLKTKQMLDYARVPYELGSAVAKLVSIAKQSAVGRLWNVEDRDAWLALVERFDVGQDLEGDELPVESIVSYATSCVEWSQRAGRQLIDFDDMLWLPVVTPNVQFWRNDWVLVDEAQDTNPTRRLLAAELLKPGGRMLWVGDRNQAIYGFTGADANAIDLIVDEFKCTSLPLTVTYRCPKAVVNVARRWVSHIEAHETAPAGVARNVSLEEFSQREVPTLTPEDAVLCRNTKPLVELAFALIRQGIGCHVEGRDIGQGLVKLATKWKRVKTVVDLVEQVERYRALETAKLAQREADYAIEALNDRLDTLIVLTDGCETVDEVVRKIESMFQDTNGQRSTVTLSTVHKAKGREWTRVYVLGFDRYMPSKWARQLWQQEQEANLCYVAATRAKSELVLQLTNQEG